MQLSQTIPPKKRRGRPSKGERKQVKARLSPRLKDSLSEALAEKGITLQDWIESQAKAITEKRVPEKKLPVPPGTPDTKSTENETEGHDMQRAPERPACRVCKNTRYLFFTKDGHTQVKSCEACDVECLACGGYGERTFQKGDYSYTEICSCKTPDQRVKAFNSAKIPAEFCGSLLGGLKKPPTQAQRDALLESFYWAKEFQKDWQEGLFFYGPPGTGKTLSLCRALTLVALRTGVRCRYLDWNEFCEKTRTSWNNPEVSREYVQELAGVDLLFIDELGRKKMGDWETEQLNLLVHARYNAQKPTFFCSNFIGRLKENLPASTWSRIEGRSYFLEVTGTNFRSFKKVRRA